VLLFFFGCCLGWEWMLCHFVFLLVLFLFRWVAFVGLLLFLIVGLFCRCVCWVLCGGGDRVVGGFLWGGVGWWGVFISGVGFVG